MKKIIVYSLLLAITICSAKAQTPNPTIPSTPHNPNQKPIPQVKIIKKLPDLAIGMLDIISATYYPDTRRTSIKVSVKITNAGTATSPASIVAFEVYTHDMEGRLDPDRKFWQKFGEPFSIPALTPGSTITRFATYHGLHLVKDVTYRSHLQINPYGAIEELSNANNQTAEFNITIN
jgi:CARDB